MYSFEAAISLDDMCPSDAIRERVYDDVHVRANWPVRFRGGKFRVALQVRGPIEPRDAPAFVELFFHDLFLLLNLSAPGSFGGTVSVRGGALRVRDLSFDARLFAYAAPRMTLPLENVIRWYDGLNLGTQQLATSAVAIALVQLLHLARVPEREEETILRLAIAADAIVGKKNLSPRLFELRDAFVRGHAPVIHPMHDDALDPRVEDAMREWIVVADAAATAVIHALQERISLARITPQSR